MMQPDTTRDGISLLKSVRQGLLRCEDQMSLPRSECEEFVRALARLIVSRDKLVDFFGEVSSASSGAKADISEKVISRAVREGLSSLHDRELLTILSVKEAATRLQDAVFGKTDEMELHPTWWEATTREFEDRQAGDPRRSSEHEDNIWHIQSFWK